MLFAACFLCVGTQKQRVSGRKSVCCANCNRSTEYERISHGLCLAFHVYINRSLTYTEACVDLALVLGVPFCVVPCCVFPAEFPARTNPADGTRLRTYQQLLEYLCRKADHIRTADLDFPFTETAKNRVLYTAIPTNKDSL